MNEVHVGGMRFNLDLSKPLYEQVLSQIRSSIAKGEIALGEKIPSVREMAQALKITPNTVMRAYQELERDQLTVTRRGQGTFITSNAETVEQIKYNLAEIATEEYVRKMTDIGYTLEDIHTFIEQRKEEIS
ncbi:transcriptional regulatory protein [Paenibacillus larvae subsp. larvae]|uniref:Transcriptional regulatory protein n=1 Tax=Paenibacillus larvae subsp. larvae TaxID=147375 RepID=A0A2L1TYW3_9BACL|nr:GntR family transcriptional regulator [Paenibacillus larvae]AQT86308.1 GntR family transcriptional regulator [Paenibacillus larvae subsp. pulvifaciens]AQZ47961.1 GntR family transcriptional regulator [Paenibacillus larvae subsp. pulvifaciens]AVF25869.1 transcriptional regulatory protein [Paenibacillus larvae subsp. larvae]AVF30645.1 transcriptional regulatory protein [Paenibacillus larvae subsp. larvae]MBH0342675.1 GntR family transcriptional regulator [Paenibacillus larvae]